MSDTGPGAYIAWSGGQRYFDVTMDEMHESDLVATEHPVEKGVDISDNARRQLDRITLDVFVSNAPINDKNNYGAKQIKKKLDVPKYDPPLPFNPLGIASSLIEKGIDAAKSAIFGGDDPINADILDWPDPFDAVADTFAILKWLQDYSKILTVYTSKATYENMLLEKAELKRSAQDGTGGRFRLTFKQVRIVSLAFADAPLPAEPRGESATSKGTKGTKEEPPQKKSVLAAVADGDVKAFK